MFWTHHGMCGIARDPEPVVIGGKTYNTVKIGLNVWIADNLDLTFDGLEVGSSDISAVKKIANYFNKDEATYGYNGNKYGLLYNGPAVLYMQANRSTLFPGWHISTNLEWESAAYNVNGSLTGAALYLKTPSTDYWPTHPGNGATRFNAHPAVVGRSTYYWTINQFNELYKSYSMSDSNDNINISSINASDAYVVRLVKD